MTNTYRFQRQLHRTSSKMFTTVQVICYNKRYNIYYTNNATHKITCCDINGKVQWEFYDTNVLMSPRCIATDNNNKIYVAGQGSTNVVVISPDGQSYRVLLSRSDGIIPWWIHCDRASNQLLLTNGRDNPALLYDISTTST